MIASSNISPIPQHAPVLPQQAATEKTHDTIANRYVEICRLLLKSQAYVAARNRCFGPAPSRHLSLTFCLWLWQHCTQQRNCLQKKPTWLHRTSDTCSQRQHRRAAMTRSFRCEKCARCVAFFLLGVKCNWVQSQTKMPISAHQSPLRLQFAEGFLPRIPRFTQQRNQLPHQLRFHRCPILCCRQCDHLNDLKRGSKLLSLPFFARLTCTSSCGRPCHQRAQIDVIPATMVLPLNSVNANEAAHQSSEG